MNMRHTPPAVIIIDGDDDGPSLSLRPSRSSSDVSSASSTTLRAESPEPHGMPDFDRLSMEPLAGLRSSSPYPRQRRKRENEEDPSLEDKPSEDDSSPSKRHCQIPIDLTDDTITYSLDDEEYQQWMRWEEEGAEIEDSGRKEKYAQRNPPIELPCAENERVAWQGGVLRAGKTVELSDGAFLQIKTIVEDLYNGEITLRGWSLKRTDSLEGLFSKSVDSVNELCFMHEVDLDDPRPLEEQSITEVGLGDVVRIRKLICTNKPRPTYRWSRNDVPHEHMETSNKEYVLKYGVVVVRWKFISTFENAYRRCTIKNYPTHFKSHQLVRLSEEESSLGRGVPGDVLRTSWRGDQKSPSSRSEVESSGSRRIFVDLEEYEASPSESTGRGKPRVQSHKLAELRRYRKGGDRGIADVASGEVGRYKYTFGDMCKCRPSPWKLFITNSSSLRRRWHHERCDYGRVKTNIRDGL